MLELYRIRVQQIGWWQTQEITQALPVIIVGLQKNSHQVAGHESLLGEGDHHGVARLVRKSREAIKKFPVEAL